MAEYEWLPGLGSASGSGIALSVAGGDTCTLATSLYPLPPSSVIRSASIRVLATATGLSAAQRTFKYVVIALNDYDVDDFSCLYMSQDLTHTGVIGTETFTLTAPCVIPKFGRYFSGLLYSYAGGSSAQVISSVFPTGSKLPSSSDQVLGGLAFALSVGRQIPQAEFVGTASRWLMVSQELRQDEGIDRSEWLDSLGTDTGNGYGMTVLAGAPTKVAVIASNLVEVEKSTVIRSVRIRTVEDCTAYVESRRTYKFVVIGLDSIDEFVCRYISQPLITTGAIGVETFELSPSYTASTVDREFIGLMHEGAVGVASSKVIRNVWPSTSSFWSGTTLFASNPTSTVSVGKKLTDLWGNQAANFWLMLASHSKPAETRGMTNFGSQTGSGGGHTLGAYKELLFSNLYRRLPGGAYVSGASLRVVTDSTSYDVPARTFRYVVLEKVAGEDAAYIRFISNSFVHTGAVGTESFSFTDLYRVPWTGDFYGGLLYTYEGGACAFVVRGLHPYGAELPTAITEYRAYSTTEFSYGELVTFPVSDQQSDAWDLLSETLVFGDRGETIKLGTDSGAGEQLGLGPNANLVACTFGRPLPPGTLITAVNLATVIDSSGLTSASRTFKYVVIDDAAGVKTCRFLSASFTHTGALGEQKFTLDPPFHVPHTGNFYGGLVYTNTAALSAFIVRSLYPATSEFSTTQFLQLAYPSSLAVNTVLAFAGSIPLRWLMLAEDYRAIKNDWSVQLGQDIDSGLHYAVSSGVAAVTTNLNTALHNGEVIRRVRIRVPSDSVLLTAASRTFKYVVIENAGGTRTCRYVSQDLVHTGAAGTETFELTTPYTVPAYGGFYGGLLYTNAAANSAKVIRTVHPATSSLPNTITRYAAFHGSTVSAGTVLTFSTTYSNEWVMLSEQQWEAVVNLTPEGIAGGSSTADDALTAVGKALTAASISAAGGIGESEVTIGVPLTPAALSSVPDLSATITVGKSLTAADISPVPTVDVPAVTVNRLLSPDPINAFGACAVPTMARAITLTPAALAAGTAIEQTYLPLAEYKLWEGSSRTPDAGLVLSWEISGHPLSYTWYDKVVYRFHLVYSFLTEKEFNKLEQFCDAVRLKEIDYAWPFDNRLYRCIFVSDLKQILVRNSSALGTVKRAEIDMIGYEVS